jgi:Icc-related predicted phosphoesterase
MRIACISDTHGRHRQIDVPPCDVLVIAGDMTWRGEMHVLHDLADWCAGLKLRTTVRKAIVAIAGNHDVSFDPLWVETSEAMAETAHAALTDGGIIYLEDSTAVIDGISFYGSPWSPRFGKWAFQTDGDEDERRRWKIGAADVIVTHPPPLGILDWNGHRDERCGSRIVREMVTRVAPMLHVFGHLHPGRGLATNGVTTFVNAASVDKDFNVLQPIVVDLMKPRNR